MKDLPLIWPFDPATTPEVQQFRFQGLCSQDSTPEQTVTDTLCIQGYSQWTALLLPANILQPVMSNLHKVAFYIEPNIHKFNSNIFKTDTHPKCAWKV